MNTSSAIWHKLRRSKKYREEFVAAHVKRAIPHQARALMKAKGMTQEQLAHLAGLSQGVVSRAVDPSNGNLTLNTIIRIAAGFDVAFVGRFVPFSELAKWYVDLPNQDPKIPSFEEEDRAIIVRESPEAKPLLELTTGLAEQETVDWQSNTMKQIVVDSSAILGAFDLLASSTKAVGESFLRLTAGVEQPTKELLKAFEAIRLDPKAQSALFGTVEIGVKLADMVAEWRVPATKLPGPESTDVIQQKPHHVLKIDTRPEQQSSKAFNPSLKEAA